jgi:NDP-sugar pyrophosphorylase family protein
MEIYNRPVKNLFDNFAFAAEKFGGKPLFCFARAKVDYEISYREFSEYAAAMTRGFIHLGLAGKRVAIIGENCVIGEGAHIGDRPERIEDKSSWGVAVIGHNVNVSANAVAAPKAMISQDI